MQLLDVVTDYLHGPLETELYIKPPPMFLDDPTLSEIGRYSGMHIQKALYSLKQVGHLWYQRLHDLLIDHQFSNDPTLPCKFVYKRNSDFVILAIYVDDINLVGTPNACRYATNYLKSQFDIKLLGQTTVCLRLQISHLRVAPCFYTKQPIPGKSLNDS